VYMSGRVRDQKYHLCCHTHCVSCVYVQLDFFVHYESIKREVKIKPVYECRCDERLQTKTKRFTCLSYTGLVVELEHLKIKTRSTNENNVVYYESIKRELKIRCIYECRCDERLQTKPKEFTCLGYTGLVVELEHPKIEKWIKDLFIMNRWSEIY
jgi:hypothetical protein